MAKLRSVPLKDSELTLLEQAKKMPDKRMAPDLSDEQLDLVRAWMDGEVSITQIVAVIKMKSTANVYVFLARGARELHRRNKGVE